MIFTLLMSLFSLSLDLLAIIIVAKSDKDLEIIILRQQVRLLQTQNKDTPGYLIPKEWFWRPSRTSTGNPQMVHASASIR